MKSFLGLDKFEFDKERKGEIVIIFVWYGILFLITLIPLSLVALIGYLINPEISVGVFSIMFFMFLISFILLLGHKN